MKEENRKLLRIEDRVRELKRVSDSDTYLYGQGQSHAYENVINLIIEGLNSN